MIVGTGLSYRKEEMEGRYWVMPAVWCCCVLVCVYLVPTTAAVVVVRANATSIEF